MGVLQREEIQLKEEIAPILKTLRIDNTLRIYDPDGIKFREITLTDNDFAAIEHRTKAGVVAMGVFNKGRRV